MLNDSGVPAAVTFDSNKKDYFDQAKAFARRAVDLLWSENIFDTLKRQSRAICHCGGL